MNLPQLRAMHALDNPASGNVLRKIGFRPTGRIALRHSRARDERVPCALFEEGEPVHMRPDLSADLYEDARALAA
jgi:RimJ/RimL family protein N-acetyltransferase